MSHCNIGEEAGQNWEYLRRAIAMPNLTENISAGLSFQHKC